MEEIKNNAVEKVENVINNKQVSVNSTPKETKAENVATLREQRKIEKAKAYAIRLRERARIKEQKLLNEREESKRAHQLKSQELRARREERERKAIERRKDKERNKGRGGYLAAIITLGIATLILSSVLTFTLLMPTESDNTLEASYQRNFHDAVEHVNNIDLNLAKTLATKDSKTLQVYLVDLAINSELAENDLGALPLHDENKFYTTKLINQIGDFSKHLNKKLIEGEELSKNDRETLLRLYNANASLKDTLYKTLSNMDEDFSFSEMEEDKGNFLLENFNELQNLSVAYPELIYDGPFSDGANNREVKGLKGSDITEEMAKDEFINVFGSYGLKDVTVSGESNGLINCYNVYAEVNGENLYAEFSKTSGNLIMFEYQGSCNKVNYIEESALEKAEEFLFSLGLTNMKAVWSNLSSNVYTFNFAYEDNGIIVYSDLIKVRVCAETGMVIGIEASTYYTNHTVRSIGSPTISEESAKSYLIDGLEIENGRLVLIPIGSNSEKLCYEFEGNMDNQTYYIYIDATNGHQVEMFKVIESSDGKLLA